MFRYRLCDRRDEECWISMNREFMAEEIQDKACADKLEGEQK